VARVEILIYTPVCVGIACIDGVCFLWASQGCVSCPNGIRPSTKAMYAPDEDHAMKEEPFSCSLCGRCCMGFGRYITVLNQKNPQECRCRETITRREFTARVDGLHLALFKRPSVQWTHPAACPFLRQDGETYICTVHSSRPSFCREYRCVRMRVERDGVPVGELRGKISMKTEDAALSALWDERIVPLDLQDPAWRQEAARILEEAGYDSVWYVDAQG